LEINAAFWNTVSREDLKASAAPLSAYTPSSSSPRPPRKSLKSLFINNYGVLKEANIFLKVFYLILTLSFSNGVSVFGQAPDSSINANIRIWNKYANRRQPNLSLYLEKSRYTPNENLLFTAYLLDRGSDTSLQHIPIHRPD
jgi:hypothetical protein